MFCYATFVEGNTTGNNTTGNISRYETRYMTGTANMSLRNTPQPSDREVLYDYPFEAKCPCIICAFPGKLFSGCLPPVYSSPSPVVCYVKGEYFECFYKGMVECTLTRCSTSVLSTSGFAHIDVCLKCMDANWNVQAKCNKPKFVELEFKSKETINLECEKTLPCHCNKSDNTTGNQSGNTTGDKSENTTGDSTIENTSGNKTGNTTETANMTSTTYTYISTTTPQPSVCEVLNKRDYFFNLYTDKCPCTCSVPGKLCFCKQPPSPSPVICYVDDESFQCFYKGMVACTLIRCNTSILSTHRINGFKVCVKCMDANWNVQAKCNEPKFVELEFVYHQRIKFENPCEKMQLPCSWNKTGNTTGNNMTGDTTENTTITPQPSDREVLNKNESTDNNMIGDTTKKTTITPQPSVYESPYTAGNNTTGNTTGIDNTTSATSTKRHRSKFRPDRNIPNDADRSAKKRMCFHYRF